MKRRNRHVSEARARARDRRIYDLEQQVRRFKWQLIGIERFALYNEARLLLDRFTTPEEVAEYLNQNPVLYDTLTFYPASLTKENTP